MRIVNIPAHKHLTQTERKAITAILEQGLSEGQVGRKVYRITKTNDLYSVTIESTKIDDYGRKFPVNYTTTFSVEG